MWISWICFEALTELEIEMITPKQAEALAQTSVQDYVNKCGCQTTEDIGNVLMKLVSLCGLAMCAVGGKVDAVARLKATAEEPGGRPMEIASAHAY
ncbi:hypothetical protein [Zoogloea sp.]|uniref:hypothetical protein n=1 Tax=Zoogloea sp. TaxID=49181 RepID=UPI0035B25FC5